MEKNLFSMANVDVGNFVLFGPRDVKFLWNIKELKVDVVYTGKRVNDSFVLSAFGLYIEKISNNDNAYLGHARLGHLSMDKLKAIVKLKLVNSLPNLSSFGGGEVCKCCQFGKVHWLPFDKSTCRCKTPLKFIHMMGPTKTPSFFEYSYMLIFVHDYNRFTWLYFVKHKS